MDADFSRLFWDARKAHRLLARKPTGDDTAHQAALAFAREHAWPWAEILLEASRLDFAEQPEQALRILATVRSAVPEPWNGLFHFVRGSALSSMGRYREAISGFRRTLRDPGTQPRGIVWNNLGFALALEGKYDEAIDIFRKALDEPNPYHDNSGEVWNNIGRALAFKGEHGKAVEAYRKALDILKYDASAITWSNLASALIEVGDRTSAEEAFEKALASTDLHGAYHARARAGLQMLRSSLAPAALSPDDRAMVTMPVAGSPTEQVESRIIAAINQAGDTQYEKYMAKSDSTRDNVLSILRGWSSAVTLLEGSERRWRGGGYFLKWRGFGVVIDPGFDFLRNFHDAGYHGREIHAVVVSHDHPDHNSDLKAIDDLRYELFKRSTTSVEHPYVLLWDEDTSGATAFGVEKPQHQYDPITMPSGFPQPFDLRDHPSRIPVRIRPFKVNHGDDVRHAMGFVAELLDEAGASSLRIGYTADTSYFAELHRHLAGCDILIAHISQPSIEELQDATKLKEIHLGYRGTARLLEECNPKLALIGEYWAGFTDLRIMLVKGLRQRSGVDAVLPAGLSMNLRLPSLDIECTECAKPTPYSEVRVAPATDHFGSLSYLCPICMIG